MGQRTNGLSETDLSIAVDKHPALVSARAQPEVSARAQPEEPSASPTEIEHEIVELRRELTGLVQEVDRRRHDAFDLRLQLRRHASVIVVVLGGASLLLVGRWALRSYRYERSDSARARAANLARAIAILSRENPDRLLR